VLEVNGMAHVILTVSSFERAKEFYGQLMPAFGLNKVFENEQFVYWVGGRTALGIQRCEERYQAEQFAQYRVGLHHLCFRARSRTDVNKAAERLKEIGAEIVRGPQEGIWAPGYYYLLFEDPDKIRLEICFVPGDGVLEEGRSFRAGNDFQIERPEQR
jgi:catechol 2,3-dioxygenase-like lactoylglutathione lyase family enzyme